jgi:hypothetical protein
MMQAYEDDEAMPQDGGQATVRQQQQGQGQGQGQGHGQQHNDGDDDMAGAAVSTIVCVTRMS